MAEDRRRVVLKSRREIEHMRQANRHTAEILAMMCAAVAPGVTTWELDRLAREEIAKRRVTSAFLGYYGYPAVICASINEEVVHGIPRRDKVIAEGDIVSLDFGVVVEGYVGDSAKSVVVGAGDAESAALVRVTRECLERAIERCTPDYRLSDIGQAVQTHAEAHGFGVVRDFVGHGIGTRMHEEPSVPNYFAGHRPRLREGMVLAVEPMLNAGGHGVRMLADGWTAVTKDGRRSAHFEHSIAITANGPDVLSLLA
jgi:methionyl aminopeptidase